MNTIKAILLLAAAWTALIAPFTAEGASVTSVIHGSSGLAPSQVSLHAVSIDGRGSAQVDRTITIPGSVTVDLPPGMWELSVDSTVYWSAPRVVSESQSASLDLWPAGFLRGTVKPGPRGVNVQELRVSFAPSAEGSEFEGPSGESRCSIEKTRWRCLLPAGKHDVRLLSRGYAAEFGWNQEIQVGSDVDLGEITFRRGASLFGFVAPERGVKINMKEIVVAAKPRPSSLETSRRSYTAVPNGRGFFQIAGLPAGEYLVYAEAKRLRSEARPAIILEDKNAELRSSLVLAAPRRVAVTISPSRSSENMPWGIRLYAHVADARSLEEVRTSAADKAGGWHAEVVPGQYLLQVTHSDGSVWSSNDLVVEDDDVLLTLSIPAIKVSGDVALGDRPLPDARLVFGGVQGSVRQTLVTDSAGRFEGEIPARIASEKGWEITIEADLPQVQRTSRFLGVERDNGDLRFAIKLPCTIVKGRVVNEDGGAEAGSIVTLKSPDDKVFEQTFAGADGAFELFGFDPGEYRIQAEGFQRSSDIVTIQATEAESTRIDIVLRNDVVVLGRIRSGSSGVAGTTLTALPRGAKTAFVPTTTTDGNGAFRLRLPPNTAAFDLAVVAPGFAVGLGRVVVPRDQLLTIGVNQRGGGLVLEIPVGEDAVVLHDGAEFRARWLARLSGGSIESRDGVELVSLHEVESGEYSLCGTGGCKAGFVAPHGTLTLSLSTDE